jgi:hypothetical protein
MIRTKSTRKVAVGTTKKSIDAITNMVFQERAPRLRPRTPAARQEPADRALRDLDPELCELAVDPRRSP